MYRQPLTQTKRYGVYLWSDTIAKTLVCNTDKLNCAMIRAAFKYNKHKERVHIAVHDAKIQKDIRNYYPNGREVI